MHSSLWRDRVVTASLEKKGFFIVGACGCKGSTALSRDNVRAMPIYALHPLPQTITTIARAFRIQADLEAAAEGWRLRYTLLGELDHLHIPPPLAVAGRTDGLWRHTCFELFCGKPEGAAYLEFNLSPSGAWASYRFACERTPDTPPHGPEPIQCTVVRRSPGELTLDAHLPIREPTHSACIGLSAVLETRDGSLSYWALRHPYAHPDFHARAGWLMPVSSLSPDSFARNPD